MEILIIFKFDFLTKLNNVSRFYVILFVSLKLNYRSSLFSNYKT